MYDEGQLKSVEDIRPARVGLNVAREKAAIEGEVMQTEKNLSVLHSLIDELYARLDPVLAQTLQDETTPQRDTYGSSRLCRTLYEHNNSIEGASRRVAELIRRVEV